MRLLLANEGIDDPGGVDTYLRAVCAALASRGHEIAFLHYNRRRAESRLPARPAFGVLDEGLARALGRVTAWRPDLVFSHNMQPLEVEQALLRWPVVKMMHGYFGTCISGQKARLFPAPAPCAKRFNAACLAHYFPRRCGKADAARMVRQYRWAKRQQALFGSYSAIVVASDYMRDEYIRNGAPAEKVYPLPLFAPAAETSTPRDGDRKADRVLFFGRMTPLKGGDLLVKAVAYAAEKLGRPVPLTMAGDGPARPGWEALARELRVPAEFPGWIDPATRPSHLRRSIVLAMPSVWPEPFGLVGLEAAAEGVPTIAFDTGGVRAWLQDGISGVIAGPHPDAKALGRALVSVCSDENRRLQLAAGALATARAMTIDRHVERLVDQVLEPACASRLAL